jgi:16S rRNA (uracil1498-N3)-methyltransferase
MASSLSCVNNGGPASQIRLNCVPQIDEETSLPDVALAALLLWQARPGEVLTVIDPETTAYRARITCLEQGQASCVPFQRLPTPVESLLRIDVYQPLPDKESFELVLQKLTELGVTRIVPLYSRHSVTPDKQNACQEKLHFWSEVISKSARQCRRSMLPELLPVQSFTDALACAASAELRLMLCEGETHWSLVEGLGTFEPQSVALLVGPEGGFSPDEVKQTQAEGFLPVSLGPRLMRTETVSIVAVALVQSYLGDLS